ncbi:MAG: UDP-N-acetylmuramoyl-L-alanyl-D-glutamate--2,6-diaminopimelate ligase [Clostridia bacterium]|nr:UDP-N-acetylmuramoyl-L-alanyl-D-glutamate--2,6-diaminopimelate ligase [Clostridia bacterium]
MRRPLQEVLSFLPDGALRDGSCPEHYRSAPVSALCYDSRLATEGTIFFCLVGKLQDGHTYAESAYRRGCRFFVAQRELRLPPEAVVLTVPDTRIALADCAAAFYGHPEREMRLIGLTGTKGKTTTALLIQSLLNRAGIPAGYIGTNGVDYADYHFDTVNSTPESVDIYRHLRGMLDVGIEVCALEVSSQALWMGRTRGLCFDSVLFLNLSRDHIGGVEHPTFAHYRDSKRLLFTDYPAQAYIVNADDAATAYMTAGSTSSVQAFSTQDPSAFWYAERILPVMEGDRPGTEFSAYRDGKAVCEPWFLPLPGEFNVQNALAALAVVCGRFGVEPSRARRFLADVTVAGRFETITSTALPGVTFVIDYAHNGVSLASILDALRAYTPRRLICLFGSVGGRTKERRRDLAEAAAYRCDLCVLTADNPASEPVSDIIRDIDRAFPPDGCPRLWIPDREEAIRKLVDMAEEGDIILLAGKGHETYQLIGTTRIPFSEAEILKEALRERALADILG